jgi:PAS domain S-box-containing protein
MAPPPFSTSKGTDLDVDHRLTMPDGRIKYVHVVAHAGKDAWGNREFVGAISDVTATKQAEERHEGDQRQIRRIIDAIPQHIVVLGPDGETLYANQVVLDYTGLTLAESQGEAFRVWVFHPEDVARVRDERRQALARGILFALEQRARRHDGQYRWFLMRYNPYHQQADLGTLSSL